MELINKEDAVALIKAEMDKIRTHSLVDGTARLNLRLAKNIIEDMPSIDLADYVPKEFHDKTCEAMAKRHQEEIADMVRIADRPQGEWIFRHELVDDIPFTGYRCSNCNYWQGMGAWNFCPNCGADMREREGE